MPGPHAAVAAGTRPGPQGAGCRLPALSPPQGRKSLAVTPCFKHPLAKASPCKLPRHAPSLPCAAPELFLLRCPSCTPCPPSATLPQPPWEALRASRDLLILPDLCQPCGSSAVRATAAPRYRSLPQPERGSPGPPARPRGSALAVTEGRRPGLRAGEGRRAPGYVWPCGRTPGSALISSHLLVPSRARANLCSAP